MLPLKVNTVYTSDDRTVVNNLSYQTPLLTLAAGYYITVVSRYFKVKDDHK